MSLWTSDDGETWTNRANRTLGVVSWGGQGANVIGVSCHNAYPFGGSIDLMNTYVKVNNEYLWNGTITTNIEETIPQTNISTVGGDLQAKDIWLDTSQRPYVVRKYDGSSDWENIDYVLFPQNIEVTSGSITQTNTLLGYSANGWDEQLSTPDFMRQSVLEKGVAFSAPYSGWIYNYTEGITHFIDKNYTYTPNNNSNGTWYYSPLKGC